MNISRPFNPFPAHSSIPLTARQREVFEIIQKSLRKSNIVPTMRELGKELGISSVNGVRNHLDALERKGYIQRNSRFSRSITLLTENQKQKSETLILGTVSDCRLKKFSSEREHNKLCTNVLNSHKDCFLIQFKDDSLLKEYTIRSGDYLLLRSVRTLKQNDSICVMDASDEVYLVRNLWNEEKNQWDLYSCGKPDEQIQIVKPTVLGVVVTLLRFEI